MRKSLYIVVSLGCVIALIAGAFAAHDALFAPPRDQSSEILALKVQVAALQVSNNEYLTRDELVTQADFLQKQIDCLTKFADNTQIVWGGGLPDGDYFLAVSAKDKYTKGCT